MLLALQAGLIFGGEIIAVLENHESIGARILGTRSGEGSGDCAISSSAVKCQLYLLKTLLGRFWSHISKKPFHLASLGDI